MFFKLQLFILYFIFEQDIKKVFGELKPLLSKNKSVDGSIQIPNDKMSEYQANGLIMKLFNMSGEAKVGLL